jgi:hypothetical protein
MARGGTLNRIHGKSANGVREETVLRHGKPGLFTGNRNCPLPEPAFSTKKGFSAADDLR